MMSKQYFLSSIDLTSWFMTLLLFCLPVELDPGVDHEGLDVARECLEEAFNINNFHTDYRMPPELLVDIFSRADGINNSNSDNLNRMVGASTTTSTPNSADSNVSEALKVRLFYYCCKTALQQCYLICLTNLSKLIT